MGRSPGERNGNPLQYSCLENPIKRGAWWATVHGVAGVGHNLATKPPPLNYCLRTMLFKYLHSVLRPSRKIHLGIFMSCEKIKNRISTSVKEQKCTTLAKTPIQIKHWHLLFTLEHSPTPLFIRVNRGFITPVYPGCCLQALLSVKAFWSTSAPSFTCSLGEGVGKTHAQMKDIPVSQVHLAKLLLAHFHRTNLLSPKPHP